MIKPGMISSQRSWSVMHSERSAHSSSQHQYLDKWMNINLPSCAFATSQENPELCFSIKQLLATRLSSLRTCVCAAFGWVMQCVPGCAAARVDCPAWRGWSCSRWAPWAASPAPESWRGCCVWRTAGSRLCDSGFREKVANGYKWNQTDVKQIFPAACKFTLVMKVFETTVFAWVSQLLLN